MKTSFFSVLLVTLLATQASYAGWFSKEPKIQPINSGSIGKEIVFEYSSLYCTDGKLRSIQITPGKFFFALNTTENDCYLSHAKKVQKKFLMDIVSVSAPETDKLSKQENCNKRGICDITYVTYQTVYVKANKGDKAFPVRYILNVEVKREYGFFSSPGLIAVRYPNEWFE